MSLSIKLQRGFSLIEILVTLLIVAIGLMGTATMQLTGLSSNQGAYLRSQASILVYDMADRMRLNADGALNGHYDNFKFDVSSPNLGSLKSGAGTCTTDPSGCNTEAQSSTDKYEWAQNIIGAASGNVLLPGAVGSVSKGNEGVFTVSVSWEELDWEADTEVKSTSEKSFSIDFLLSEG